MSDYLTAPPHDIEAEQCALGAAMLSAETLSDVLELVAEGDFYRPAHQVVYRAMADLCSRGEPVDAVSVNAELVQRGQSTATGGSAYLHTLTGTVPTAANGGYYARIVADRSRFRGLMQTGMRITQMALAAEGDAGAVEELAVRMVLESASRGGTGDLVDAQTVIREAVDRVELLSRGEVEPGLMSGLPDLDEILGGFKPGQMIVVGARPAMGKSVLGLQLALHVAMAGPVHSLFISQEMSRLELGLRMLSSHSRTSLNSLNRGQLAEDDWCRVRDAARRVGSSGLWVDDQPRSVGQVCSISRRAVKRSGVQMVVVDYLQLLEVEGSRFDNRQHAVSDASRSLKLLARELEVPVVVLAQLNRGPEQRADKRPQVSDLRESGAIEQDADVVVLIHREDVHDKESPRSGEADLIVAKHRNGPTGEAAVAFQGHYSRFTPMPHWGGGES